jgi:hypothetical protein
VFLMGVEEVMLFLCVKRKKPYSARIKVE